MRELSAALVESGNAPVIYFDDVGHMVVANERIWYPMFIVKPSLCLPGQFENELVAWATNPLRNAPSIIARAYHTIRPHRPHIPHKLWPAMQIAKGHH